MTKKNHRPQRTCLGCGARAEGATMIRLAATESGRLELSRRSGRGGYLHRDENCWALFIKRKGHFRAFRIEISRAAKEEFVQQLKDRDWE